jgi:hypothetical protein
MASRGRVYPQASRIANAGRAAEPQDFPPAGRRRYYTPCRTGPCGLPRSLPQKEAVNCRDHRTTSSKSSAAKISRRRKTKRSSARSLNAGSRLLIRSNLEDGARPGKPCAGAGRACRSSHCSDPTVAGESRDRAPVMSVRRSPASERSGALLRQRATLRRGTARRSG